MPASRATTRAGSRNLHVAPGWYYFTAAIRSDNVGDGNTGASIGLMEDGIISQQLHGTRDWTKVGFYLKAGDQGADIVLACRLGGFASLNTGKMACRDFKGVKLDNPPDNDTPRYDLDVIRNGGVPPPAAGPGANVALPLALAILVLAGLFAWRRFGRQWMRRVWTNLQPIAPGASGVPLPPDATRKRIEIALLVVTLLSFAYFYQAADHSTGSRFDLMRSILERGSLWIDGYCGFNTADIVELRSHIYSNKAPGGAFTGLLPWLFITSVMRIFLAENQWFWAFATYLGTVFSVSVLSSILVVLTYRFRAAFRRRQRPRGRVGLDPGFRHDPVSLRHRIYRGTDFDVVRVRLVLSSGVAHRGAGRSAICARDCSRDGRWSATIRPSSSPPGSGSTRYGSCGTGASWRRSRWALARARSFSRCTISSLSATRFS